MTESDCRGRDGRGEGVYTEVWCMASRLSLITLPSDRRAVFASAVADLAMRLETNKSDFQHYMDWCVWISVGGG